MSLTGLLQRYARWACVRPSVALVVIGALVATSFALSTRLGLDASFEALLPADSPSVRARQEARERIGATDLYLIAITSPDPRANHRFAEAVAEGIRGWEETQWVMDSVDVGIFRDRALMFMDLGDLTELVDLVELGAMRGVCEAVGNCAERDLRTDSERRADSDRLEEIIDLYQGKIERTTGDRSQLASRYPDLRDALMSPDGTSAVVIAQLSRGTDDIEFSREVMLRGEGLIDELDPARFHPEMDAEVSGAYCNSNEYDAILRDVTTASFLSLVLVILVTLVLFRRVSAVLLLGAPLLVGVAWSLGLTALTYPTLNTITAVIFGVLFGMGIDFSIHLYVATRSARAKTENLADALATAIAETTPAMATSALTTAGALLTLGAAHNRGFREFGLLGAGGILLCLLASWLVMPPLWGLAERLRKDLTPLRVPVTRFTFSRVAPLLALVLGVGLCATLLWRAPSLAFEYNLSNLTAQRTWGRIPYAKALRTSHGTNPSVLLGDSPEQLRRAHDSLVKTRDSGDDRLLEVITIETFLPLEQEEKLEQVERLRAALGPRILKRVSEERRGELNELARLAKTSRPIVFDDLPDWARRTLRERNGKIGHIGFLYTPLRPADAVEFREFQDDFGQIETGDERPVRVASTRFVIADVVYVVRSDGQRIAILALAVVALLLLAGLRSWRGALLCLATLLLGIGCALGATQLLGWKLGVYNILVIPVALGLGIDGAIHLYSRFKRRGRSFGQRPLGGTGLAILASSLTTAAGFSGLLAVQHLGLESMGRLAVLSIGFTLVAVLGVLTGVLVRMAGSTKD